MDNTSWAAALGSVTYANYADFPQESVRAVAFTLTAADMSSWDVAAHAWKTFPAGEYAVWVASSSRDLRLQGTVSVAAAR